MRKILLLIIILYNLRNSFADATNDSIKNYLTSNIKYPTINSENNLIGSVLLLLKNIKFLPQLNLSHLNMKHFE